MRYVSIDLESCGLDTVNHSILEFGAVIDDLRNPLPLPDLPVFHCYFLHELYVGSPIALSMHPAIFRRIEEREEPYLYISPMKLGFRFRRWLVENGFEEKHDRVTINVAGKNFGVFDYPLLKNQTDIGKHVKIRHKLLDPAILFLDGDDDVLPGTNDCKVRMGLDDYVAHTAVEDAFDVIQMLRYALVDNPYGPFHVKS